MSFPKLWQTDHFVAGIFTDLLYFLREHDICLYLKFCEVEGFPLFSMKNYSLYTVCPWGDSQEFTTSLWPQQHSWRRKGGEGDGLAIPKNTNVMTMVMSWDISQLKPLAVFTATAIDSSSIPRRCETRRFDRDRAVWWTRVLINYHEPMSVSWFSGGLIKGQVDYMIILHLYCSWGVTPCESRMSQDWASQVI
jgi:hypothetical protein